MKTWTVDEMLAEGPCAQDGRYSRKNLIKLWAGRERVSLLEIVETFPIPDKDKIWAATRPGALTDEEMDAWLIERVVKRAVTNHVLNCGIPNVEAWAQRWLSGEDRTPAAAWEAAWAAWAAGAAAVWEAAWAAWAVWAVWAAAGAAAGAAGAAGAAERRQQVIDLIAVLRGGG